MEMQINPQEIMEKLVKLQTDMNFVKEWIEDTTLTNEDIQALEEAEKEYERGELTSMEEIEKLREKNVSN